MSAHLSIPQGTAVWCDAQGVVREIVRDDLGWTQSLLPGQALTLAIHRTGFQQALDLLAELNTQRVAPARELPVWIDGQMLALSFSGLEAGGDLLIVATSTDSEHDAFLGALVARGQDMGRWRGALEKHQRIQRDGAHPDDSFFEQFSRLNNELAALQREMARKNAALQRAEAKLKDYAGELEQQVLQRTAALEASERRFRALFERAALGIALLSSEGALIEGNPALWQIIDDASERWIGQPLLEHIVHPDDCPRVLGLHGELMVGGRDHYTVESRLVSNDGRAVWAMLTTSLVRAEEGKPGFAVCMFEDITTEKQARAALLQTEKLALAGRLAAALTHEIGNPLQSVIGLISMLEQAITQKRDVSRYVQLSLSELRRMARTLSSLRGLSRNPVAPSPEPTRVEDLLEEMLALTEAKCAAHRVQVVRRQERGLPVVSVVPDQVKQVFLNLLLNAIESMPDGGILEITVDRTSAPPGLNIAFSDRGAGIAAEDLPHVFEPFYTTKPDGMGLGLYISRNIVQTHGGQLRVESQLGQGTRFTVWLPR